MSNNNMREIGHVFVNHAGEFQFVSGATDNMPGNAIMVYCTEDDFSKSCDSAKRLFNCIKGELQMLTGGKWGEAHCLNCGFSLGARITCPHCGYINSVEKTAESIHDCGGAQHHRYADHIADAGKVIAEPVKRPQNCGTGYCSCIECPYEPVKQEPVAIGLVLQKVMARLCDLLDEDQFANIEAIVNAGGYTAPVEPVNQEPVAYMIPSAAIGRWNYVNNIDGEEERFKSAWQPLYASPVRTKDLTDDEIKAIALPMIPDEECSSEDQANFLAIEVIRAVIAADRKKNK